MEHINIEKEVEVENVRSILPPDEVFDRPAVSTMQQVGSVGHKLHIFERIEVKPEGGMFLHFKGLAHPKKGFPFPEAIHMINIVKRNIMMLVHTVASREIKFAAVGLILTPHKQKVSLVTKFLREFVRSNDYLLTNIYLKEKYMTPCSAEIYKFLLLFLNEMGIPFQVAKGAAKIFSTVIEYDDAYRYRIQDLMRESSEEKMIADPAKEIKRLLLIFDAREKAGDHLKGKFRAVGRLISFMFMSKKIKRAFTATIYSLNFEDLQMDEADEYHCLTRDDYEFGGKTIEYRLEIYEEIHKGEYPPMVEMI